MAFTLTQTGFDVLAEFGAGAVVCVRATMLTLADLIRASSRTTVIACTDENKDGVPDADIVAGILEDAEGDFESYLPGFYTRPLTPTNDRLAKLILKEFALAYMYRRHPEYVKTVGKGNRGDVLYERAVERCRRLQTAAQRLPDVVTESGESSTPATVGTFLSGSSAQRMLTDNPDGTSNNPLL